MLSRHVHLATANIHVLNEVVLDLIGLYVILEIEVMQNGSYLVLSLFMDLKQIEYFLDLPFLRCIHLIIIYFELFGHKVCKANLVLWVELLLLRV